MLEVSSEALPYMKDLLEQAGEPGAAVRIAVMGNSGLGLIIGHPKDTDFTTEKDGLSLIIDKSLLDYCKSITIGFQIGDSTKCASNGYIIQAENSL